MLTEKLMRLHHDLPSHALHRAHRFDLGVDVKVVITTTYENVDKNWLDWYIIRLKSQEHLPGSMKIADELHRSGRAEFKSEDPSSPVEAKTVYEVIE